MTGKPANSVSARSGVVPTGIIISSAIVLTVYLLTFWLLPKDGFWINDNGCKFIQMESLIRNGYHDYSIAWPGEKIDADFAWQPLPRPFGHVLNGKLYGTYSPVFPFLSSFVYRALGFGGLYLIPLVGALLLLPAVGWLAVELSPKEETRRLSGAIAVVVTGLCTPLWFYSQTFWEHTPATALSVWSVVCWTQYLRKGTGRLLIYAGVIGALAVYFRDDLYLLLLAIIVMSLAYAQRSRRSVIVLIASIIVTLIPLWILQWTAVGSPWGLHIGNEGSRFNILQHLADRWSVVESLLINIHGTAWVSYFVAGPILLLWLVCPALRQRAGQIAMPLLGALAVLCSGVVLLGYITSSSPVWWTLKANGLFAASPVLIIGLFRIRRVASSQESATNSPSQSPVDVSRAVMALTILYVALYVLATPKQHASGIHWGCRYLLPVYPLLAALTAQNLAEWYVDLQRRSFVPMVSIVVAIGASLILQVYSINLLDKRKQYSSNLNRQVATRPEQIVVATGPFIPQQLFRNFFDKTIFLAQNSEQGRALLDMLRDRGTREVLVVAWPAESKDDHPDAAVLSDGDLNFMTVSLRPYRLHE